MSIAEYARTRADRARDAHALAHRRYLAHLRRCRQDYRCSECRRLCAEADAAGYWLDTLRAREAVS